MTSENIVIVDYRAGNLTSVRLALESLGVSAAISGGPERILAADRIIFPGVGAAGAAMRTIGQLGIADALRGAAARGTPFLGICLGAQVLLDRSDEDGGVLTLGLIPGQVCLFQPEDRFQKVPHMGWNSVVHAASHPVLEGIRSGSEFYFVHSYYMRPEAPGDTIGVADYAGSSFAAIVARGSMVATQFHPEKSGRIGLRLLKNFLEWTPGS